MQNPDCVLHSPFLSFILSFIVDFLYYRAHMQEGNVFILSGCLSVWVSVWAIIFECLDIETSFLYDGTS